MFFAPNIAGGAVTIKSYDGTTTTSVASGVTVLAADYQDGVHAFGAFSIGATWNFTKDIGVMIGYNFYNDGYFPNTFTTQLDINI